MKTFSEQLSEYVERVGVSDAELARRLGVSRQTIFRWREGRIQRPRFREDVLDLAKKLRLTPQECDLLLLAAGFPPVGDRLAGIEPERNPLAGGSERGLRRYLKRYGIWALVGLAALAVWLLISPDGRPSPAAAGELLILVSEFTRAGGEQGFNVASRLEQGIQDGLEDLALEAVRVEIFPEPIETEALALSLLEELDATLIVWGEYDSGRVVAQILSRDLSGEALPRQKHWLLETTQSLSTTINLELPQEVTWLALFAIGRSLQVREQYDLAQGAYETALGYVGGQQAREAQLYFYLGYVEALKGEVDLDRVIAYYSEALSRQAGYVAALNNRALAYMGRGASGDLERAREDLLAARHADPNNAKLHLNLGLARIQLAPDELGLAVDDFEQAAALDPDSPSIQNALCWYGSLAGDPEEALAHCERAVALDPSGNNYDSLGLTLALLGRYEQAAEAFQTALSLLEHHDPQRYLDLSDSRRAWIEVLSVGGNPFDRQTLQSLMWE